MWRAARVEAGYVASKGCAMRGSRYKPIIIKARTREEFDAAEPVSLVPFVPATYYVSRREFDALGGPRPNPPRPRRPADFQGLQVKLTLVYDVDYDADTAVRITSAEDVYQLMQAAIDDVVEGIWVVIVNARHRVVGVYEAARGGDSSVSMMPVDIFRAPIAAGASRFIMVHNHPSGDIAPSGEDVALTRRCLQAAKLLGMTMLDHVIVGHAGYTSIRITHDELWEK